MAACWAGTSGTWEQPAVADRGTDKAPAVAAAAGTPPPSGCSRSRAATKERLLCGGLDQRPHGRHDPQSGDSSRGRPAWCNPCHSSAGRTEPQHRERLMRGHSPAMPGTRVVSWLGHGAAPGSRPAMTQADTRYIQGRPGQVTPSAGSSSRGVSLGGCRDEAGYWARPGWRVAGLQCKAGGSISGGEGPPAGKPPRQHPHPGCRRLQLIQHLYDLGGKYVAACYARSSRLHHIYGQVEGYGTPVTQGTYFRKEPA